MIKYWCKCFHLPAVPWNLLVRVFLVDPEYDHKEKLILSALTHIFRLGEDCWTSRITLRTMKVFQTSQSKKPNYRLGKMEG